MLYLLPPRRGQPLYKGRACLSTRDKGQRTYLPCREAPLYKGQRTRPQLVPCREAPLYKGQRTRPQLVPCREAPLYKGQRTRPQLVPCREAPLYKGQRTRPQLVPCREAPLYCWEYKHGEAYTLQLFLATSKGLKAPINSAIVTSHMHTLYTIIG